MKKGQNPPPKNKNKATDIPRHDKGYIGQVKMADNFTECNLNKIQLLIHFLLDSTYNRDSKYIFNSIKNNGNEGVALDILTLCIWNLPSNMNRLIMLNLLL